LVDMESELAIKVRTGELDEAGRELAFCTRDVTHLQ